MKCSKCGKKVRSNVKFCTYCGNYVGETNKDNNWQVGGDLLEEEKIKTEDGKISEGTAKTVEEIEEERELEQEEQDLMGDGKFHSIELTEEEAKKINPPIPEEDTPKENDFFEDKDLNDKELEVEKITVKDSSGTKKGEYSYEHEDLLEAYIGEDYKIIKKMPINIWAFLLNWMYLLYRKLYITGVVGLIITWIVVIFLKPIILYYIAFVMILLGIFFNKYYIFIAKKRVEKIIASSDDDDKFVLASTCKEKGGVNVPNALLIYFAFLIAIFFSVVTVTINMSHNPKFWQENSENRASCMTIIKTAYKNVEAEGKVGNVTDAVCKVMTNKTKEYEVYLKSEKEGKKYYSYYITENGYVKYKNNTLRLNDLQVKNANAQLSDEERQLYSEIKPIELNYQDIYNKAKEEEELVKKKKNTAAKTSFFFTQEEIIQ